MRLVSGGSSPLARGTSRPWSRSVRRFRLIPARAGNMKTGGSTRRWRAAHPRSRGEHPPSAPVAASASGSSPLARGTSSWLPGVPGGTRLIPARAGNIPEAPRQHPAAPAHPRSRGEHTANIQYNRHVTGSSPLARGTSLLTLNRIARARLIPARAGNMVSCGTPQTATTAHPRSRGEHTC